MTASCSTTSWVVKTNCNLGNRNTRCRRFLTRVPRKLCCLGNQEFRCAMEARFVVLESPCCIQQSNMWFRCWSLSHCSLKFQWHHGNLDMEFQRLPRVQVCPRYGVRGHALRPNRACPWRQQLPLGTKWWCPRCPLRHGVLRVLHQYVGFFWFFLIIWSFAWNAAFLEFQQVSIFFKLPCPLHIIIYEWKSDNCCSTFYLLFLVIVFGALWSVISECVCVFQGSCCYMAAWINTFLVFFGGVPGDSERNVQCYYHCIALYCSADFCMNFNETSTFFCSSKIM